jgi:hypothetical protein
LLAAIQDYLFLWQLPLGLVLLLAWVGAGGYLLHRAVREPLPRRKGALGRCLVISFLALAAGIAAGGSILLLVVSIDKRVAANLRWLAVALGAVSFLLINFVVLCASFNLPVNGLLRTWVGSYGPAAALAVVIAIPTGWYAHKARQAKAAQEHSLEALRRIHHAILHQYAHRLREPPPTLQAMVDEMIIEPRVLRCRNNRGRAVDYFYQPAPVPPDPKGPRRILACDFIDNHNGQGRAVLFTDGAAEWYPTERLPELFDLAENRAFVEALRKAEAGLEQT